jgi:hypothetical protein
MRERWSRSSAAAPHSSKWRTCDSRQAERAWMNFLEQGVVHRLLPPAPVCAKHLVVQACIRACRRQHTVALNVC